MNVVTMPTESAVPRPLPIPSGVPSSSSRSPLLPPVPASSLPLLRSTTLVVKKEEPKPEAAEEERQPDDDGRRVAVSSSGTGKMIKEEGEGTNDEETNPDGVRSVRVVKQEPPVEAEKNTQGPAAAAAAIRSHMPPQDSIIIVPVKPSSSGADAIADSDSGDNNHDSDRNPSTPWDTGDWCWLFPVGITAEERTRTTQSTTHTTRASKMTRGPDSSNNARHKDAEEDADDPVTTRHTEALSIPAPVVSSSLLPVVPSSAVSSSSIIPSWVAKKEDEEEVVRPNEDNTVLSTRKPTICGHNNKRKTKEENFEQKDDDENKDENENDSDDVCVAAGVVNKERQETENKEVTAINSMRDDDNSNNDNFYSDWATGNWCWPEQPVTKTGTVTYINQSNTGDMINMTCPVLPKNDGDDDDECYNCSHDDNNLDRKCSFARWKTGNWCWIEPMTNTAASANGVVKTKRKRTKQTNALQFRPTKKMKRGSSRIDINISKTEYEFPDEESDVTVATSNRRIVIGSTKTDSRNDEDHEGIYYDDDDDDDDDELSSTEIKHTAYHDKKWNSMLRRLLAYKDKFDSVDVPLRFADDRELGRWVRGQRHFRKINRISSHRIDRLESIGFSWNINDKKWMRMYHKLIDYKKKFDSDDVPHYYVDDRELGTWVKTQRDMYKSNTLSSDRIERLESLGFTWNIYDKKWMRMYHKLIDYKKKFDSVDVPHHYDDDRELGEWVCTQRVMYKRNIISSDRIERLESIEFTWNIYDTKWMLMYNRLVAYTRRNKSTCVPYSYNRDPELGHWVSVQRFRYHTNDLATDRINQLESIEFVWS